MHRDAMTVIAHPFVGTAPTMISLHCPIVTAQLVAVVVRAIDSAIATLMLRYTIAALASPFLVRAFAIFSFVVKCVSLCCVFAEFLTLFWRLAEQVRRRRQLLILIQSGIRDSIDPVYHFAGDLMYEGCWNISMTYRNYAHRIHLGILEYRYRLRTMEHTFYPKCTYIDPQHIDLTVMALVALIKQNEDFKRFKKKFN